MVTEIAIDPLWLTGSIPPDLARNLVSDQALLAKLTSPPAAVSPAIAPDKKPDLNSMMVAKFVDPKLKSKPDWKSMYQNQQITQNRQLIQNQFKAQSLEKEGNKKRSV